MIQIVSSERYEFEGEARWNCWLELAQGEEAYSLPATAPGHLAEDDLLAYFEADEDRLWAMAQERQYPGDLYQPRKDFEELANKADVEVDWLEATIPTIEAMTLEELRATLKRLAQENLYCIRAWRYVLRKLT